jgi:predicted nucleic acid-binding protein
MASTVLLDTTILIHLLRDNAEAETWMLDLTGRGFGLAISCITVAELFAGVRPGEEAATEQLLSAFDCLPVTREIAEKAGWMRASQRRAGRTFALDDMMIAATAIQFGYPLVTDNRKDFEVPELELFPSFLKLR